MIRLTGFCLLILSLFALAACDNAQESASPSVHTSTAQNGDSTYTLLEGKLTFTLPAVMQDQSQSLNPPSTTKFIYSDATGMQSLIVLIDPPVNLSPADQAQGLVQFYQKKVPDMKVLLDKSITIDKTEMHRLDLFDDNPNRKVKVLSVFVLGNIDNQVVTFQLSMPANDMAQAQKQVQQIIDSIKLN
ncbi:MAG: DcrB-related protein [Enterobacteriaceae bacterium]